MSRLVVVSNRIAPPDNKTSAGGLAVGVLGALKAAGDCGSVGVASWVTRISH